MHFSLRLKLRVLPLQLPLKPLVFTSMWNIMKGYKFRNVGFYPFQKKFKQNPATNNFFYLQDGYVFTSNHLLLSLSSFCILIAICILCHIVAHRASIRRKRSRYFSQVVRHFPYKAHIRILLFRIHDMDSTKTSKYCLPMNEGSLNKFLKW